MSDVVLVAVITAAAGVIGGIVGAVGSPIGKDWVSRREFERTAAREDAERQRRTTEEAAERKRQADERKAEQWRSAISDTLEQMSDAMAHYDLEWRGKAPMSDNAAGQALIAAAVAWRTSRGVGDDTARALVDEWKQAIDGADTTYRRGAEPQGRAELEDSYAKAAERLGELLRSGRQPEGGDEP